MATQDDSGISFKHAHDQQGFRLLELPPALLETITSENPPVLSVKSLSDDSSSSGASSNAVLCTPDQTFQLRQVHSSNTLFLVRPSQKEIAVEDAAPTKPDIVVIGTSKATLELRPVADVPCASMRPLLRLYNGIQEDCEDFETMDYSPANIVSRTRKEVWANVPASDKECAQAWKELCAFEHMGNSWVPAASALSRIWKDWIDSAPLSDTKLSSTFHDHHLRISIEEAGHPHGLHEALLAKLAPNSDMDIGECRTLDRGKCVAWVGAIILESYLRLRDMRVDDFLERWANHLPEEWREDVSLEVVKDKYTKPTPSTIRFDEAGTRSGNSKAPTGAQGNSTGRNRKWHEKFRVASKT
ncbi:MAG: hypothetical protein M1837_007404 [Sclerophora amabilis]|nr:MAG: hypothetical protein M1837_007404 [Sclerophora amabilis]